MERDIRLCCTPSRQRLPALQEQQVLYLLVELLPTGGEPGQTRLPLDICLVLDCSSSMRGDRLHQAKEAARYIVGQLTPEDSFCLITFNDRATVVVPRQPVQTPAAIREHIAEIQASGGTEMGRGLEQALEQMLRVAAFSGVRRLILLTDGQTYGDEQRCVELARQAQEAGIGLTTLGVGTEWNEDLLATMAAYGNSRSEYIAGEEAIVPLFREEMRLLQGIVAQEMALALQPASQVQVQHFFRVSPEISPLKFHETWEKGYEVPLGEWLGDSPQVFLAELVLPALSPGRHHLLDLSFSYRLPRERSRRREKYELVLPCLSDPADEEVPLKVRRGLEKVTAYRLQEMAWQEARRGQVDQATRRLASVITRLVQMGEEELARRIEEETRRLQRTGQTSAAGQKEIRYSTRRLGRRWLEPKKLE
ncbi:MAG: vWA domain-containing protein [Chloroflexia bacterium]